MSALCAALLAIDPRGLGGALLLGPGGPEREAWVTVLRGYLTAGCPLARLPVHAGIDRILGGLDLTATLSAGRPILERGILASAEGGFVVVPSAERLPLEKAALIAAAMDTPSFAVIAFDERAGEDEGTPAILAERLAFHATVDATDAVDGESVAAARAMIVRVTVSDAIIRSVCEVAVALGIVSQRAAIFAVRAARALAALDGRLDVAEEDAAMAARLVLAPRARTFPQDQQQQEDQQSTDQSDATNDESSQTSAQPLADVILDAVKAALPPGVLAGLMAASAMRAGGRSGPGAMAKRRKGTHGRPAGTRPGNPRDGARLDLIATLRAAAPWQRLRSGPAGARVKIRRDDLRVKRMKQRSETTAIFAVDASGSAALHRLAEAKGAVELILAECYIRRDKAALVAFRGKSADILLPPTRSLERARRSLAALPGGGGTPLASGIEASALIADQVRRGGGTALLVFLTDGRANIARDGTANRATATEDALAAARLVRMAGHKALLIDLSPEPNAAAQRIAEAMSAAYMPLPHADARSIARALPL